MTRVLIRASNGEVRDLIDCFRTLARQQPSTRQVTAAFSASQTTIVGAQQHSSDTRKLHDFTVNQLLIHSHQLSLMPFLLVSLV